MWPSGLRCEEQPQPLEDKHPIQGSISQRSRSSASGMAVSSALCLRSLAAGLHKFSTFGSLHKLADLEYHACQY